mgnify:CR=1 FL=1
MQVTFDNKSMQKLFITKTNQLNDFCQSFNYQPHICLDTEFVRQKTFWPTACLIQIQGQHGIGVVDVLSPDIDLTSLHNMLYDKSILKILHSARQDLEIFWYLYGQIPTPIADTQIMAMICGFGETISYENLVAKIVGAAIDKSLRVTDWSQRPLSDRHIEYAANDVSYLLPIYQHLVKKLKDSNDLQLEILQELISELENPKTYVVKPENAWKKFVPKYVKKNELLKIKKIAAWREIRASQLNLPRQILLSDDKILSLAKCNESRLDGLITAVWPNATDTTRQKLAEDLNAVIIDASQFLIGDIQDHNQSLQRESSIMLVDLLKLLVKIRAAEQNIPYYIICSTDDIQSLIDKPLISNPLLSGWRYRLCGQDCLDVLLNRKSISIKDGKIKLFSINHLDNK